MHSTIIQKLSVFSMPKNARMTSMNTLDFKTVGFPKYMSFKMPAKFYNKRIKMIFIDDNGEQKGNYTIKVGFGGFVEYNFADSRCRAVATDGLCRPQSRIFYLT